MNQKIRVAIFEDNNMLRDSLRKLFAAFDDFELTGVYPNALNILDVIKDHMPQVVLMDIDMPGINGIEAVKKLKSQYPAIQVLMQTVFDDDEKIFQAVCAGADGYLLKKTPPLEMLEGVRLAAKGQSSLSPSIAARILHLIRNQASPTPSTEIILSEREKEILYQLTKGLSYKMIAESCSVSIDTVRFHIKNIYAKLHVHSMTEAVAKALKDKLV
jgi:DNA-binding NarL/FixJ family response regulator